MYSTFANEPRLSDRAVAARMERLGKGLGRDDYPATRTVNKYRELYNHLPEHVKAGYRDFRWPESMEAGLLPWPASAAALELLGIQRTRDMWSQIGRDPGELPTSAFDLPIGRPSVRLARWFWRVTQSAPDLLAFPPEVPEVPSPLPLNKLPGRYYIAQALAVHEAAGEISQRLLDAVETYFAYAPWRDIRNAAQYSLALGTGQVPELDLNDMMLLGVPTKPYPKEAIREMFGPEFAEYLGILIQNRAPQPQSDETKEDANGDAQG
jgi:hypothetical protein